MVSHKTIPNKRHQLIKKMKNKKKTITSSSSSSSPSLPTLHFDLITEILIRLPVKFLLQFQCVCKSWKSLISDPKFTKKHLTLSTTRTLHCISYSHSNVPVLLKSYTLDSVLTNITQTQFPSTSGVFFVGSCNGILFLVNNSLDESGDDGEDVYLYVLQLWNPSIRKFKELPPLIREPLKYPSMYGFGYDSISDNYKVVVVFGVLTHDDLTEDELMNEVNLEVRVHTLGTDLWKNVLEFPFAFDSYQHLGQHVTGTINWLVFAGIKRVIASFDLGKECYREGLLPDDSGKVDKNKLSLSVLRDCLCMISDEDVWVMKEYGNKESWTKLFIISYLRDPHASSYPYIRAIRVFEDEQVLLIYREDERWGYISYNYKNNTSKFLEFEKIPEVCVESLISPLF